MKKYLLNFVLILFFIPVNIFAQFGQNKVQYKNFTWYYIQTDHFDIYFSKEGSQLAEFTAKVAEDALKSIENSFNYKVNNRITIIVYNSTNDFQETNITDQYLSEGIEGFTEMFKNRVVVQFMGSYPEFRHLIHHELTHAVMNDFYYGGSLQNIITNNISLNLPQWFNEGMAEYQSLGWDINTDMFIRDAIINDYLPDIQQLSGYLAYRGGESVFHYIAAKYGKEKIGELVNKIKGSGSLEEGFKETLGLTLKEFNERWKKHLKKVYWPDISIRKDPDEFSKRLTDPEEGGGFYNTSPAISPQGDKLAFISNRNYYFDVFIMSTIDGKIIKRLVKGNRSADFEQLNVVTPGLSWSPDGNKIALSAKSDGSDIVYIIDVNSEDKKTLPIKLDGIKSLSWSPDGKCLAFIGHTPVQSDVYIYNFKNKNLINLTNDVFTDNDPSWSPDSKTIFFSSDRGHYLTAASVPDTFKVYNYLHPHTDIYSINLSSKKITRLTDMPNSDEIAPVVGPQDKEMLFISDMNGINNIYKKRIQLNSEDTVKDVAALPAYPVTNSLNGLYQLTISKDGKKLVFSSLYKGSYNLFLMNNPLEIKLDTNKLVPTVYITSLDKKETMVREISSHVIHEVDSARVKPVNVTENNSETTNLYGDSVQIDFNNYVFGDTNETKGLTKSDSVNAKFKLTDNLDRHGDYKVNRYKINFSPDIVYANAGYSTLYGLLGTTVLSFSDVLGNYRIIGQTSLQIDLKNSDYGLAYFSLKKRLNYGLEAFHTARFVYLDRYGLANLFRFRNYGAVVSLSYPINRYYRFEGGLSWLNVSMENLDNPDEPYKKDTYIVPSLSFVHDNSIWGYTAPIDGTRYRFDVLGSPGVFARNLNFYSILGDYRTYFRFWYDYSFAFRLSGGYSGGHNPQRFFLGGVNNWINREFATSSIPLNSPSDFAFLTAALPLRGFDYAQEIGTRYGLMNMELRFPLIRYLLSGALPILFRNIIGVAFIDAGTAWNYNKQLQLFSRNENGRLVTKDLLSGTGVGARIFLFYFLVRFDVAWAYNFNTFSRPKFYISLGADF
jgi:Tol biopolymer transport system component